MVFGKIGVMKSFQATAADGRSVAHPANNHYDHVTDGMTGFIAICAAFNAEYRK